MSRRRGPEFSEHFALRKRDRFVGFPFFSMLFVSTCVFVHGLVHRQNLTLGGTIGLTWLDNQGA